MFAPDVRLEGFTTTDWTRLLSLFRPRRIADEIRDPDRPVGGVVAVHSAGKLCKLVHTHVGRLRLDDAAKDWPLPAETLARRHQTSWASVLEFGCLERIMDRFGARARRGDDLLIQTITFLTLVRDEVAAGRMEIWPHRLRGVPIPSPAIVRGTMDSICPAGKTAVIGLFDDGELWTSLAVRRTSQGFDLVLGPEAVRRDMGLLSGDWRRDHRHLAKAVEDRAGPLGLGCFAEMTTFRKLEVDTNPGAWARAVAIRNMILSPLPPALTIPLGIDAGRAAFQAVRNVAEGFDALGIVGPVLRSLIDSPGNREQEMATALGFNPLELLRKLLTRDR